MKNLCVLFLAILANILPSNALAGAWLQPKGEGQVITTLRLYTTWKSWDGDGNLNTTEPFVKTDFSSYAEYGISDRLTLGGEFDLAGVINQDDRADDITKLDFSYGTIFARAYLHKGENSVISIEPAIMFPKKIGNDLVSDGGEPIPELKLSHGYAFNWREQWHFTDASIKYRMRNDGDLDDMLKAEFTFGLGFTPDYTLLTQLTYEHNLGDVDEGVTGNYNLLRPQVSVLHKVGYGMSHQYGVFANVEGDNTGAGYGMLYSFWFEF